jgi:hypothetical protein
LEPAVFNWVVPVDLGRPFLVHICCMSAGALTWEKWYSRKGGQPGTLITLSFMMAT